MVVEFEVSATLLPHTKILHGVVTSLSYVSKHLDFIGVTTVLIVN